MTYKLLWTCTKRKKIKKNLGVNPHSRKEQHFKVTLIFSLPSRDWFFYAEFGWAW